MASHVTGNPFYEGAAVVDVIRDAAHTETMCGLQFFTPACLDKVIQAVDAALDVPAASAINYAHMRHADMRSLNALRAEH